MPSVPSRPDIGVSESRRNVATTAVAPIARPIPPRTITAVVAAFLRLSNTPMSGLLGTLGMFVVLPVVLLPLYYVFPSRPVTVTEALPGAVFAGGGWTILGTAFGVYASVAGSYELYGVLGGVLLLLVWFYFAGLVLLVGAALNVVIADRTRY